MSIADANSPTLIAPVVIWSQTDQMHAQVTLSGPASRTKLYGT